ncbi:hypothetical protein GCM10023333_01830 [Ferrimonas pelagia]|uniref:Uncharacterized protein n=1 Tax=Ferrimonas pelagia TaxID=1177826 RepID=A0ABP9EAI6_9GAMM
MISGRKAAFLFSSLWRIKETQSKGRLDARSASNCAVWASATRLVMTGNNGLKAWAHSPSV